MASSSHSNSDLYKCPDNIICREEFTNLDDFFSKQHWEKHEKRCPMAGCMASFKKRDGFIKHWLVKATHLEYLGLPEQLEVCNKCGESYIRQYKGNHKRNCGNPKSNKRKRDHDDISRISKEAYGDVQTIMHAGSPPSNSSGFSGPVPAHHGTDFEADLSEYSEWLMDFSNSGNPLPLSTEVNNVASQPENFDHGLEDLMETISPSSQQQQQYSVRSADEVALWVPQHLEHFGLQEEREVSNICGESSTKGNKFNHERRHPTRPESNKRRRIEAENDPATLVVVNTLRDINESDDNDQSVTHPNRDGILQGSPTWEDISGLGLAGHGTGIEADCGEIAEWLMDFSNSENPLPLSTEFNNIASQPENFDHELEDLMEIISPSSQQQRHSARPADEVASRVPHLGMEPLSPTTAANDMTTLMLLSPTTGLSNSHMIVIPPATEFADANDVTFQSNVQPAPQDFDWSDDGHFPGINTTYDFEQPGFMLTVLENTGSHPPVIDRYRLDQRRYKPAPASSRTMFTYSQEVAVKRFAPGMTPQSITVLRQWLRKVELLKRIRAKRFWRLRIVDQRIDIDAPLVKSTRIIRVSKFHFSDHIFIHTDCCKMFEDDHPAFVYCKQGHWQELNEMLSKKEVTVADVNSDGQTLLHVSKILLISSLALDIKA
jgi:hypothetical protein